LGVRAWRGVRSSGGGWGCGECAAGVGDPQCPHGAVAVIGHLGVQRGQDAADAGGQDRMGANGRPHGTGHRAAADEAADVVGEIGVRHGKPLFGDGVVLRHSGGSCGRARRVRRVIIFTHRGGARHTGRAGSRILAHRDDGGEGVVDLPRERSRLAAIPSYVRTAVLERQQPQVGAGLVAGIDEQGLHCDTRVADVI
jgi:hypothetical protein